MSEALVKIARSIILKSEEPNLDKFWQNINAGTFVTAYKKFKPTSENVWCCMSNGVYDASQTVEQNIKQSAHACATRDTRVDKSVIPVAFEVNIFAPRHLWVLLGTSRSAAQKMQRDLQRAFMVQTNDGLSAVYLPDVWNQYAHWTAHELIENLSRKAGGTTAQDVSEVYEIPCFVEADQSIPVAMQDRGFFAALILQRAWEFYNFYKQDSQLAYQVDSNVVSFNNKGAWVRSYADVAAYSQLATLLNDTADEVVEYALANFEKQDMASLAAHMQLRLEIRNTFNVGDLNRLVVDFNSSEFVFARPQIVILFCQIYRHLSARQYLETKNQIQRAVTKYFQDISAVEAALVEHGGFAANWYLQAVAAASQIQWSCLIDCKTLHSIQTNDLFRKAITVAIDALQNETIAEQACAAHGLLAVNEFDFKANDQLLHKWARMQYEWNMHGGFRYYVAQSWYRSDITSHVVQVCLLIRYGNRK